MIFFILEFQNYETVDGNINNISKDKFLAWLDNINIKVPIAKANYFEKVDDHQYEYGEVIF